MEKNMFNMKSHNNALFAQHSQNVTDNDKEKNDILFRIIVAVIGAHNLFNNDSTINVFQ